MTRIVEDEGLPGLVVPQEILRWVWRKKFLHCLKSIEPLDKDKKGPFWTSLASEVLPKYRQTQEAYESALLSLRGGSPSERNRPWHNLLLRVSNQEEVLESIQAILSLPCGQEILDAWRAVSEFSARWHVDLYTARRGAPTEVVWMRRVIYETLSQWSLEEVNSKPPEFHLPPEVLDTLDSYQAWARELPPVYDVDDRYAFGPGIGEPGQGSPPERAQAFELFKKVPHKVWIPSPLPAYNPMGNADQWKKRVTALFEKDMREHIRQAKTRAKNHGFLLLKDKMRAQWHLECLALFQVGGFPESGVYGKLLNKVQAKKFSLGTVNRALQSTSMFLDLPLRKASHPKK